MTLNLSDRTTEDLLRVLEAHESREFRLPSAHVRAVRDEIDRRALGTRKCQCGRPVIDQGNGFAQCERRAFEIGHDSFPARKEAK